jgi:hypothetical protein
VWWVDVDVGCRVIQVRALDDHHDLGPKMPRSLATTVIFVRQSNAREGKATQCNASASLMPVTDMSYRTVPYRAVSHCDCAT